MEGDTVGSDAVLNIRYGEHLEKNARLDDVGKHLEDLLDEAGLTARSPRA